jgi:hypothetical protein
MQNPLQAVDPIEETLQQLEDLHAMHGNGGSGDQAQALGYSYSLGQLLWAEDSTGGSDGPAPARLASVTSAALVKVLQQEVPAGPPAAADNPPVGVGVAVQGSAAGVAAAEGAAQEGSAPPAAVVAGANSIPGGSMDIDRSSVGSFRMGLGAVSNMLDGLKQQIQQLEPQQTSVRQAQHMSAHQHQGAHMQLLLAQQQQQAMQAARAGAYPGMQWLQQQRLHGAPLSCPLPRLATPALAAAGWVPAPGTGAATAGAAVLGAGMSATPDARLIALQLAQERNMGLAMPSPGPLSAPSAAAAAAGSGSFGHASSVGAEMSAGGSISAATIEEKVAAFQTTLGAMQDMIGGIYKIFGTLGTRPAAQAAETHRFLMAQVDMLEQQQHSLLQQMQAEGVAGTLTMQQQQVPMGAFMGGSLGAAASSSAAFAGPMGGFGQGMEMQMHMQQQQQLPNPAGSWAHPGYRPMH